MQAIVKQAHQQMPENQHMTQQSAIPLQHNPRVQQQIRQGSLMHECQTLIRRVQLPVKRLKNNTDTELLQEVERLQETLQQVEEDRITDARKVISSNMKKLASQRSSKKGTTTGKTPSPPLTDSSNMATNIKEGTKQSTIQCNSKEGSATGKTPSPSSTDSSNMAATIKTGTKKKRKSFEIPKYSDDESSVNDGVDYTNEDNYAVKKIIGHTEIQKKRKGKEIQLITRWKGWREKNSITLEPLENMIQDWPTEVRNYCERNEELKLICQKHHGHLFDE
jgi:hypothetical protein